MFERFTDRARQVVALSQTEARNLKHNYIGTEHIVLGIMSEGEGVAARVLFSLGYRLDYLRTRVTEAIGLGNSAPAGHIPFTPRAKKVLELALREALQLGHSYIGTEHILLGLIREGEGMGAQVLGSYEQLSGIRRAVIQFLSDARIPTPNKDEPTEIRAGVLLTPTSPLAERIHELVVAEIDQMPYLDVSHTDRLYFEEVRVWAAYKSQGGHHAPQMIGLARSRDGAKAICGTEPYPYQPTDKIEWDDDPYEGEGDTADRYSKDLNEIYTVVREELRP